MAGNALGREGQLRGGRAPWDAFFQHRAGGRTPCHSIASADERLLAPSPEGEGASNCLCYASHPGPGLSWRFMRAAPLVQSALTPTLTLRRGSFKAGEHVLVVAEGAVIHQIPVTDILP